MGLEPYIPILGTGLRPSIHGFSHGYFHYLYCNVLQSVHISMTICFTMFKVPGEMYRVQLFHYVSLVLFGVKPQSMCVMCVCVFLHFFQQLCSCIHIEENSPMQINSNVEC